MGSGSCQTLRLFNNLLSNEVVKQQKYGLRLKRWLSVKCLSLKLEDLNSNPQHPCKSWTWYIWGARGENKWTPPWPAGSRLIKTLSQKIRWRVIEDTPWWQLASILLQTYVDLNIDAGVISTNQCFSKCLELQWINSYVNNSTGEGRKDGYGLQRKGWQARYNVLKHHLV